MSLGVETESKRGSRNGDAASFPVFAPGDERGVETGTQLVFPYSPQETKGANCECQSENA
jgi:hypothetical protein